MIPGFLVPLLLVAGTGLLLPRSWFSGPAFRRRALQVLICALGLVLARYLFWRVTQTLPTAQSGPGEVIFFWTVLLVEMAIWVDGIVFFATLARPRDNTPAADRGEARLRASAETDLPSVDVFIATYNEDLEVLEKTITGAAALDWPASRLRICVLDDGRRAWLREFCDARGVDYFTRDDNAHAKAGNINAAIARTDGDFFLILDADFIPQRNFLYRAMGLFEDERVGIVQIPHSFYNADPMQANLGVRDVLPDDQRLFFGRIMAARDGWDTAFCCGSNSITRRAAIEKIGGAMPTGSITEDMLLTLALLRKGFVTRYLNERLAIGLAPESLTAFYVQRARWARGAIQILFLKEGPFGPGLRLRERIMFVPLHWVTQPLVAATSLLLPPICLWTGWSPLPGATLPEVLAFQIPVLFSLLMGLRLIAPESFFPVAESIHTCLEAPRTLPTVISTLIRPHGHAFKVTPKGRAADGRAVDRVMVFWPALVVAITALGIWVNVDINTRIVEDPRVIPLLVFWSVYSMIVLSIVQAVAISRRAGLRDEKFRVDLPCAVEMRSGPPAGAVVEEMSLSEAHLAIRDAEAVSRNIRWIRLDLPGIGCIPAYVVRHDGPGIDVVFRLDPGEARERMVRYLFTGGHENAVRNPDALRILGALLARASGWRTLPPSRREAMPAIRPAWLDG